jgi:Transglycosylase SLT domain
MPEAWDDDGAWGSASRIPVDQWFPVRTETGEWELPGPQPTLARSAGMPDVNAPAVMGGTPDQAPLALGQVAGTMAPQMTAPASMARVARADQAGLLTPKPTMWESIARAIGQASPTGQRILQASDQQQQQQLQNRLVLRRQQLAEEQEARQVVKDEYATLIELSKVKSKALRNMYFDRQAARLAEAGKPYPADFIESFKKSALDEGQIIAQAYGPLLEKIGYKPEQVQGLLEGGDLETIKGVVDAGLKVKKFETEADELKELRRIQAGGGGTLAGDSGVVQAPQAPATTPTPTAPAARPGTVPPVLDTAVTDATKLYPQVRSDLVHGMIRHESNYDVGAVSPKGAIGPMQLMPGTAKDMGVDPKDPAQNVRGGVRYYAQLLTKYGGNEALALAAYNWGPGNVDKVDGDLTKMPAETQAYVKNVLASAAPGGQRGPADTRQQVAGPGAPAPTTAAASAGDTAALTRLKEAIAAKQGQIQQLSGLSSERANKVADNMRADLKILQEQYNRLEDQLTETPRAVAKQTALEAGETRQREAAAKITLEGKMNEPIGNDAALQLDLPPATKWKDVPKDRMPKKDPSAGERDAMTHLRASVAGVDRLMQALDKPEIARMVGTLFTEPEASANRLLGNWLATLSPEQRAFAATIAGEVMEIRNRLIGAGQTGIEVNALAPMMPSPADTDVATLRAKLTALREGMLRRHDAKREDLEGMGFRVPAKLTPPAAPQPLDPTAQQALDILKPKAK